MRGATRGAVLRWITGVGVAAVLLCVVLPRVTGAGWSGVAGAMLRVPVLWLVGLSVLWWAGLAVHTVTLTAALPRLRHHQAMTLSLTGSAVANVLPLGGAAGVALNYTMARGWGFGRREFVTYTLVTNTWDVLAKLLLAALVLPLTALGGGLALGALGQPVAAVGLVGAVVAGTALACVVSRRVAVAVGLRVERVVRAALRLLGSRRRPEVAAAVELLHDESNALVRRSWGRLSVGMVGYTALLFALWWACLHVVGLPGGPAGGFAVSLPAAALAFAVERLGTMAGLTPGGAGIVELGMSGVLLASGAAPVGVLASVALYRAFTFALEIPVGGAGLAAWWWGSRRVADAHPPGGAS